VFFERTKIWNLVKEKKLKRKNDIRNGRLWQEHVERMSHAMEKKK